MERFAMDKLKTWKEKKGRKPLLIRGARQVGKSWLMQEFGKTEFKQVAYINFGRNRHIEALFRGDLEPERIILGISAETGITIRPDDTLIIFDEIQETPRALESLKYFCEDAPEYAVVAAGSLLGVALHQNTSFPVGKVDMLSLYPMSFAEFLYAMDEKALAEIIKTQDQDMIRVFRERLIDLLRQYYYVGGMPEAVKTFARNKDFKEVRQIQSDLLMFYQQDFSRHSSPVLAERLRQVWNSVPAQLAKENRKFIYGQVRKGARAKDLELAIQWLSDCGLIHLVHNLSKPGYPLKAYEEMNSFKIYLLDVGLLGAMGDIDARSIVEGNRIFTEFKGAMTEQFVLQQICAVTDYSAFYYSASGSRMEIDFIIQADSNIVPIEVKAEENLHAKSLHVFYSKYHPKLSVRFSMSDYREQDWMTNVPLYDVEWLNKLQ